MIKSVILGMAAVASAQLDMSTSPNGDLRVTRQQQVDVGQVADTVSSLESRMEAMSATPTAFMQQLMAETISTNRALTARLAVVEAGQSAAAAEAASLSRSVTASINQATTSVNSVVTSLSTSVGNAMSSQTASISSSLAAVDSTLEAQSDALDTRITGQLSNMTRNMANFQPKTYMWTGGCSQSAYPRGNGWREYCLDQAHVDTSMPKFRVETNRGAYQGFNSQEGVDGRPSRFRALVAGNYWINIFYISRSHNWSHTLIYINGAHKVHGHHRTWRYADWGQSWKDLHANLVWPVQANQMFWARIYAHPGHWTVYHSTNAGGSHSRITASYNGELRGSI
jgi:hypothetical protein